MQLCSQIFVFSTEWANRSAHSVMENQCPSIIAWHESQQETKKQLEVRKFSSNIDFILNQLYLTPPMGSLHKSREIWHTDKRGFPNMMIFNSHAVNLKLNLL